MKRKPHCFDQGIWCPLVPTLHGFAHVKLSIKNRHVQVFYGGPSSFIVLLGHCLDTYDKLHRFIVQKSLDVKFAQSNIHGRNLIQCKCCFRINLPHLFGTQCTFKAKWECDASVTLLLDVSSTVLDALSSDTKRSHLRSTPLLAT